MKKRTARILLVTVTLAIALGITEAVLRGLGFKAWRFARVQHEKIYHEYDPTLGWRPKEGTYEIPPYSAVGHTTRWTNWPGGMRATSAQRRTDAKRIVVLGGSITQGWAVSDDEALPWKLQEALPDYQVDSLACAGYGTYQSMLALLRYIETYGVPEAVVYGFVDYHDVRNAGDAEWLRVMLFGSRRGHVEVPFASLTSDKELRYHEPTAYPSWPLMESSALVNALQHAWAVARYGRTPEEIRAVTEQLILELQRQVEAQGSRFLVAILGWKPAVRPYFRFLREAEVPRVDCTLAPELHEFVKGDGHPKPSMHAAWARIIAEELRELLP